MVTNKIACGLKNATAIQVSGSLLVTSCHESLSKRTASLRFWGQKAAATTGPDRTAPPSHPSTHSSSLEPPQASYAVNHFEVLGLPVVFSINEQQMKANYLKLMMDTHPDRRHHAATSDRTSLEADNDFGPVVEEVAALVTRAFDTLQKPHTRALHMLELHNKPLDEASSTELVGTEFLMDIMELREIASETTDSMKLQDLRRRNKESIQETCSQLDQAFDDLDLDRALQLTAQLQYFFRIEETLHDKMDSFE